MHKTQLQKVIYFQQLNNKIYYKEDLQDIHSFKIRGALNKL